MQETATPPETGVELTRWQAFVAKCPKPCQKLIKPLIIFLGVIAAYALAGFYVLPAALKAKLPAIIQEQTGRKATIETIEFNPFAVSALIHNFTIEEKDSKPFVHFDDFSFNLNVFKSITSLGLVIDDIFVNKPYGHLVKLKDGKFNFDDMVKPKKEEPKKPDDGSLFPLHIGKLAIKDGKLRWDDNHFAKPVSEEISPINLSIDGLSTETNSKAELAFDLALKSAGKLGWKANVGINPLFSEGKINLDNVQLAQAIALAMSDTAAFNLAGHERFNLDYAFGMDKSGLKLTVKNTKIEILDLEFTDKSETKNHLKTPAFSLESDAAVTVIQNNLEAILKKTKWTVQDLQFSNQAPDPISLKIPAFSHETDLKISKTKDQLKVGADLTKFVLKGIEFSGLRQSKVNAKIPEFDLETGLQLAQADKILEITTAKGKCALHDFLVSEQGDAKPLIKMASFGLEDMGLNLKNQEVHIGSVVGKDAEIQAWLTKDGTINYQQLLPEAKPDAAQKKPDVTKARTVDYSEETAAPENPPAAPVQPTKAWLVKINTVALDNFGLIFEDKTLKKPVVITAQPINLKLNNFATSPETKLPFQLEIGVNKTGSVKLKGETVITPLAAKADVDIKNLHLDTLQPYIEKFARLDLLDGKFNIAGKLAVQQPPKKPIDVKFKGNTNIADFLTRDQIQNKDLVKWKNLILKDIDVDLSANRYRSSLLLIEKPYAKVTIRKDKTINFSDLVIADKAPSNKPEKSGKTAPKTQKKASSSQDGKPVFKLDKVKIVDGSSDFADLSLILPFAAQIKSLDGGANGISSEQKSTIKVDLKGNAYDLAPVDINGEISPYLGNFNINLNFDGMPMPLVTPYMVEFAGYKIEKGKLTLGLKYQVEKGKLQAANNILIDQLELGEKVENPHAVSLPLELAITLLKDSDGKIKLDVPLTGSLEDPQFNIGHIIADALVNVLTKIVTSPFKAIASLVGSDADLSAIIFQPGKHALDIAETNKLDNVAKALKEKPALNLEIKGAAYTEQDWKVLREDALLDQLKSTKSEQIKQEEGKKVRSEYVELSDDEYDDLLADAFIRRFPTMAEKSLLGTPKLIPPLSGDFYQVAKEKMSELINPDPKRLKDLASERSKEIAKYIVQKAGIPNERVYILDSVLDPEKKDGGLSSLLSLKTN